MLQLGGGTVQLHLIGNTEDPPVKNPYIHRKAIHTAESFFGRGLELARIYSLIEGAQSVSIVGDRRIGKSSLLCCLMLPEIRARYPQYDFSRHLFVSVDLGYFGQYTPNEFLYHLLDYLSKAAKNQIEIAVPDPHAFSPDDFADAIEIVSAANMKIVFLLDEFDYVANNQALNIDFFNYLRSVAHNGAACFITASVKSLSELCHQSVLSSPFFNIFSVLNLSVLTRDEALALIREPSAQAGCPLEQDSKFLLDLAGTHPLLLQIACFHAFEARMATPSGPLDGEAVQIGFEQEAQGHFEYAWQSLDRTERMKVRKDAFDGNRSGHVMLSSIAFRKYVTNISISVDQRIDNAGPRTSSLPAELPHAIPAWQIAGGLLLAIGLTVAALSLGFASGVQQLLSIPLAGLLIWLSRHLLKQIRRKWTAKDSPSSVKQM